MVHAKLTQGIIYAAIEGFESRKRHINQQIAELRALGNGHTPEGSAPPKTKKRGMSAAGRRAIAEAQRKRWAAAKGQGETSRVTKSTKRKRVLSAAGRAAIIAATKKRWAAKRAAAAEPATKAAKKAASKK
jgi:hypothetical protein